MHLLITVSKVIRLREPAAIMRFARKNSEKSFAASVHLTFIAGEMNFIDLTISFV